MFKLKKIFVNYSESNIEKKVDNYCYYRYLITNYSVSINSKNSNYYFYDIKDLKFNDKLNKNKIIYYCGENLYYKKNILNYINYISKLINYPKLNNIEKLIPLFIKKLEIGYIRHVQLNKINDLKENEFAIITNKIKGKNIMVVPYFMWGFYNFQDFIKKKQIESISKKKFCAFIVSNPSAYDRIDFFKKLSKYKKVDSYGKIYRNVDITKLPKEYIDNDKLFKDYKFVICFENSYEEDYITEKLPNAMLASSIPIYRGAPNIGDYFNTESFINYDDYGSYNKMIEKIIELDNNNEKYFEYINRHWFKGNIIPQKILNLDNNLEKFYKKVFK